MKWLDGVNVEAIPTWKEATLGTLKKEYNGPRILQPFRYLLGTRATGISISQPIRKSLEEYSKPKFG